MNGTLPETERVRQTNAVRTDWVKKRGWKGEEENKWKKTKR